MDKIAALMRKLDYQFEDESLLKLALTHRSKGAHSYERLEFLGDSILGFVVADWLYKHFPDTAEGRLSRMRSRLVRKKTLADVARDLGLQDHLILGEGELKSGGFNRDSILSDTVESIIGALYLDADFDQASRFIHSQFEGLFKNLSDESSFKDAKSRLQETMQKQAYELPQYDIIETCGKQHQQQFTVQCTLIDLQINAQATAGSRRQAEQEAAAKVLVQYQTKMANHKKAKQH